MKRFHVHVCVDDIARSVRFYSTLFAAEPSIIKNDYAKWMLDDPKVNFAVSKRGSNVGLDHLGIQVEDRDELQEVWARLSEADAPVFQEGETTCCYARSEKSWIEDPQGISWETFLTTGESTQYGTEVKSATPLTRSGTVLAGAEALSNPIQITAEQTKAPCCGPTCCSTEAVK